MNYAAVASANNKDRHLPVLVVSVRCQATTTDIWLATITSAPEEPLQKNWSYFLQRHRSRRRNHAITLQQTTVATRTTQLLFLYNCLIIIQRRIFKKKKEKNEML